MVVQMEDNQELSRGKYKAQHKDIKDQVFANDDHIILQKIKEKATYMKHAQKDAKAMQERSAWGLKSEDNEPSINDCLEQKCTSFLQLEEIQGS